MDFGALERNLLVQLKTVNGALDTGPRFTYNVNMMKVYVLTLSYPYEGEEVLGVYSSREAAEKAWYPGSHDWPEQLIYEIELDGRASSHRKPLPSLTSN